MTILTNCVFCWLCSGSGSLLLPVLFFNFIKMRYSSLRNPYTRWVTLKSWIDLKAKTSMEFSDKYCAFVRVQNGVLRTETDIRYDCRESALSSVHWLYLAWNYSTCVTFRTAQRAVERRATAATVARMRMPSVCKHVNAAAQSPFEVAKSPRFFLHVACTPIVVVCVTSSMRLLDFAVLFWLHVSSRVLLFDLDATVDSIYLAAT